MIFGFQTAARMIARGASLGDAVEAVLYVAPVGKKEAYVARAISIVSPFLRMQASAA